MKTEEELLAECRAHWEATKPEAVFADYWLGWKAARSTSQKKVIKVTNAVVLIKAPDGTVHELQPVSGDWKETIQ